MEMPAKMDQIVLRIRELKEKSLETNLEREIKKESFQTKKLRDFNWLLSLSKSGSFEFLSEKFGGEGVLGRTREKEISREKELVEKWGKMVGVEGEEGVEGVRVLQMGVDFLCDDLLLMISNMKKCKIIFQNFKIFDLISNKNNFCD